MNLREELIQLRLLGGERFTYVSRSAASGVSAGPSEPLSAAAVEILVSLDSGGPTKLVWLSFKEAVERQEHFAQLALQGQHVDVAILAIDQRGYVVRLRPKPFDPSPISEQTASRASRDPHPRRASPAQPAAVDPSMRKGIETPPAPTRDALHSSRDSHRRRAPSPVSADGDLTSSDFEEWWVDCGGIDEEGEVCGSRVRVGRDAGIVTCQRCGATFSHLVRLGFDFRPQQWSDPYDDVLVELDNAVVVSGTWTRRGGRWAILVPAKEFRRAADGLETLEVAAVKRNGRRSVVKVDAFVHEYCEDGMAVVLPHEPTGPPQR